MAGYTPHSTSSFQKEPARWSQSPEDSTWRKHCSTDELLALEALKARSADYSRWFNDRYLMKFLFARKFNVDRAEELCKNHRDLLEKYQVSDNMDFKELWSVSQEGSVWIPGLRDKQNRGVIYLYVFEKCFCVANVFFFCRIPRRASASPPSKDYVARMIRLTYWLGKLLSSDE
jgi:hypothetical protein